MTTFSTSADISKSATDAREELKRVYLLYYKDLYYYGLKLSGSEELTRDCIQDMFVQFWSDSELLREVRSVKAYLLKSFRRRVISQLTADLKRSGHPVEVKNHLDEKLSVGSYENDLIHDELHSAKLYKLMEAKKCLTSRQQEILFLKFHEGYDYDTICDIMDIKYQSVRNLLSEAIKVLREKLDAKMFN